MDHVADSILPQQQRVDIFSCLPRFIRRHISAVDDCADVSMSKFISDREGHSVSSALRPLIELGDCYLFKEIVISRNNYTTSSHLVNTTLTYLVTYV